MFMFLVNHPFLQDICMVKREEGKHKGGKANEANMTNVRRRTQGRWF